MGQQALSRAEGGAVHLPQAPPQGHRPQPVLWSLHPPSILPTSARHPGLRCSLLSASRMPSPGFQWRCMRWACSPPEDRAVRVPRPLSPPQLRHRIWLLADLPDPPAMCIHQQDPRAPRPEPGTSCGPLDQHALLEAETPLRSSPAHCPPAPGRRESLSAPTLSPEEQRSR